MNSLSTVKHSTKPSLKAPSQPTEQVFFNALPKELFIEIFKNFSEIADLVSYQLVCKNWKNILTDNVIWKNISIQIHGMIQPETQIPDDYFYQFETFYYNLEHLNASKYKPRLKVVVESHLIALLSKSVIKTMNRIENDEELKKNA